MQYDAGTIDHVSFPVREITASARFYDAVLKPLELRRQKERDGAIGYGPGWPAPPTFWILSRAISGSAEPGVGLHVGFRAADRSVVDEFHRIALAMGGQNAGTPGPRHAYSAGYYGCFVIDPDGFKVEAVVREALDSRSRSAR